MATSVKVGDFYVTPVSGIKGIVQDITAHNGRKVASLVTLDGEVFTTIPRGVRAKASA